MSYQPNPNNKAFRRRATMALEFVDKYVKNTPNWLSTRWIDDAQHFGHSGNPLSQWLREKLLICVDEHYDMKKSKCKTYIRNHRGYHSLKQLLNPNYKPNEITPEQQLQLVTGNFAYIEKAERYYNSIQFIKNPIRKPLLAQYGYKYEYDIVCAAPTIIRQWADKCGMTKPTPALDSYIHNRTEIRDLLAKNLEITPKQAKQLVHAIVNGAPIGFNYKFIIYQLLNRDQAKILWLKQDPWIQQLKLDVSACWQAIKPHTPSPSKRLTGQAKSRVYRTIERSIMREVTKRLKHQRLDIRVFNEHDGWRCDQLVDQIDLRAHIKRTTGYIIDFDFEVYEYV
jgi:hypothetical protein